MPTKTRLLIDKAMIGITLLPEERRDIVMDDPRLTDFAPETVIWWYWDAEKLRSGRREFLGIEVSNVAALRESDFTAMNRLTLPRVDCSEIEMPDTTITEVLRWARRKYMSSAFAFEQSSKTRRPLGTNNPGSNSNSDPNRR